MYIHAWAMSGPRWRSCPHILAYATRLAALPTAYVPARDAPRSVQSHRHGAATERVGDKTRYARASSRTWLFQSAMTPSAISTRDGIPTGWSSISNSTMCDLFHRAAAVL